MGKVETTQIPVFEGDGPGYDADFCAWLEEQGRRLRLLRIPGLDTDNIAEEIEGLSRSDKRELASRVQILLLHLLKWHAQPDLAGRSWRSTLRVQRHHITDLLDDSPSLKPTLERVIDEEYVDAVSAAILETGLFQETFPVACPWTPEQILSRDFFPLPRGG